MIYSSGKFRGDKCEYSDGIGCCIWIPFSEKPEDEEMGIAFDFSFDDIDDLAKLLSILKNAEAEQFKE